MTSVRERRVELRDGVRLRVEEREGPESEPPFLLLHGFTGSVEAWGEEVLRGLALDRRVVSVDLPGHGGSDAPTDPERYRLEVVLDDLEEVLDEVEAPAAIWVGYSMGGRVALGAGALRRERVEAVVLESASPGLADEEARQARRMSDEALARRIESDAPGALEAFVDEWMELPLFASQQRLPDHVLREERRRRVSADAPGLAAVLRGLGTGSQPSFWDELSELDVPVLLLTGSLDTKFEGIADRMADALPNAVRRTVPDTGHRIHLEKPAAWLDAVRGFCSELGG